MPAPARPPHVVALVARLLREGATVAEAAHRAGVETPTIYVWAERGRTEARYVAVAEARGLPTARRFLPEPTNGARRCA